MSEDTRLPVNKKLTSPGPYLAKIVSHLDPTYMGGLQVQLLQEVGNDDSVEGQLFQVQYLSPFSGNTNVRYVGDEDDYNNTQKSYGMWMIPPDTGNIVVVFFIDGDPKKGYWMGCVQAKGMNFAVPGHAATQYHLDGIEQRVPTAEYNKITQAIQIDTTQIKKPASPLQDILKEQGLLKDDIRGITTSSARREIPSSVFGISTPGPIDKRPGAKTGPVGKKEWKIANAFVSRLGGSTFVMDDGDDKWERKTLAHQGPPEYVSVERGETAVRDCPHNELVRLRTRTGHQILMHNSEDLIYITNARGTTWIELTSDGKIDIYAEDSVSLHTKQDLNFLADRDINFEARRNINIKAKEEMQVETGKDYNLLIGSNGKIMLGQSGVSPGAGNLETNAKGFIYETSGGANHTKAGGHIVEEAPQIHMNGPAATPAATPTMLKTHKLPDEKGATLPETIMRRVPTHEPYPHHENLDPVKYKSAETDRDNDGRNDGTSSTLEKPAEMWKKYSTVTDTFSKLG